MSTGNSANWLTILRLMAKPTPCMRWSSTDFPFQKNVQPPLSSLSCPSSGKHVSIKAAMSIFRKTFHYWWANEQNNADSSLDTTICGPMNITMPIQVWMPLLMGQ